MNTKLPRHREPIAGMKKATDITQEHYIVAIGASAGGLEAIHDFFDNMPEIPNVSYVIIQHLSPDHKSLLVELVSRHTHMKVYEAEHNLKIEKNCIYVIPNNKLIKIERRNLVLSEKPSNKAPNNAIDVFLEVLAKEKKSDAIAVLLSGTGTDGTKGIKSIKDAGGLVIVQEPSSAKFDGMPNSAITSGNVDLVLKTSEIPKEIARYIQSGNDTEAISIDDRILQEIFELIYQHGGSDFHYYKTPTIMRRIHRRMTEGKLKTVEEYLAFLRKDAAECKQLGKEFLINVTKFFRDAEAFEFLKQEVVPKIIAEKNSGDTIKVWVCACSTGEEAYSIAIMLDEALRETNKNLQVKIFATDLERSNIDIASRALYPHSIQSTIPPQVLSEYFTKQKDGYQVSSRIRKQIVFAQHNVIKDPPFIKNDLVTCRNMLIYMDTTLQQRVYSVLLFGMNVRGYLFLGSSESPQSIKKYLQEVHAKFKIYYKVSDARVIPYIGDLNQRKKEVTARPAAKLPHPEVSNKNDLWADFRETLISEFNFAAFYIDRDFEIKEAIGNFDQILSLPKKILKLNLLRMLPPNISTMLVSKVKESWKENNKKIIRNLHFKKDDHDIVMQIMIKPENTLATKRFTLVAFHFMPIEDQLMTEAVKLVYPDPDNDEYVLALEEELNETKYNLQHAIEDLETANEELQSSNEELLSANEELQSSNEELQSLNEELHTLNAEHQIKIKELVELNDDLNNYFRSSDIGQIFLDKNLLIRKYNPASAKMVNFIESDIGRPISHISTNIRYNGLVSDIEEVFRNRSVVEREVKVQNGKNMLMKIMPYVSHDPTNTGIIITFIDITAITELNNIIRGVFNSSLSGILAFQAIRTSNQVVDFKVLTSNVTAASIFNLEHQSPDGKLVKKDLRSPLLELLFDKYVTVIDNNKNLYTDVYDESQKRWFEVSAVKMMDGIVSTFTDVTQRRNAEDRLKKNYVELVTAKENLRKLNGELEIKIAERTQMLSNSEERFRLIAKATNDALWDWDIVNNKTWFSEMFYKKFGYEEGDHIIRSFWIDKIHPEDRASVEQSIGAVLNYGKSQWSSEYRFRKANGDYAYVLDRGYILLDDFQTPFRMLGSMLDLTDLKRTEAELASNIDQRTFLAESMPLLVWTTTAEGEVDFINRQFEVYTGRSLHEIAAMGWKSVLHPSDIEVMESHWRQTELSNGDLEVEVRIRLADGTHRWNLLRAKARREASGDVISWVMTAVDIHEQKMENEVLERKVSERTKELQQTNQELELSNLELQQFASVASHDLQEPLRKIHMFAAIIRDRYPEKMEGAKTYLDKIMHSSERMKAIIASVLQFSRLSIDDAEFIPVDFNDIIENILDDLEILVTSKHATFEIDRFPMIEAIHAQIHQVFLNLISNALKFSKPDEPLRMKITCERIAEKSFSSPLDDHGPYCRITLSDNGIGFDTRFAEQIFVLFQRLHTKDRYEGTGIGLAIVKKIIEKHYGIVTASGVEGKGATFTLIMPLKHVSK